VKLKTPFTDQNPGKSIALTAAGKSLTLSLLQKSWDGLTCVL
jgi:hypothetical protein